jgi:hypothetical protein
MDKRTGAERRPRDAGGWITEYRPLGIDAKVWEAVLPFVLASADRLGLDAGPSAVRVVRALARLTEWGVAEGLPLDVEVVLDPDTVERFVTVGLKDDRSRATYRAVLRRVGPLLTTTAPWEARPTAVARRQVAVPYSSEEIAELSADALAQPTARRVRAARALLALGAGAGLDGRWVARVVAEDVTTDGGIVAVRVGEPSARVVPVLARWEDEVLDLAASARDEFVVGGRSTSRNRASALAASLVVGNSHPRFSASRLRSTWLVTHLAMGTRMPELARAAGLQGVTVLSDSCLSCRSSMRLRRGRCFGVSGEAAGSDRRSRRAGDQQR